MNRMADRRIIIFLSAFFFLFIGSTSVKGDGGTPRFMENKGQWPDQVSHAVRVVNTDIFFEADRLRFNFFNFHHDHDHDGHDHAEAQGRFAYDVNFLGSSDEVQIHGSYPFGDYTNYILGSDPAKWASRVKAFGELKYSGLYEGIDLVYRENDGHLKYDIMIAAGADPSVFRMEYEGVNSVRIEGEKLIVSNPLGSITESAPIAFQVVDGKRVYVDCDFVLVGNEVSFAFPSGFDSNLELIIDPTLIFSSYTGAGDNNFGFTATYDDQGSLYGGGLSFGQNYPLVVGSFQEVFGGAKDMGITKFTPDGTDLVYSTFVGGNNDEIPNSMVVNNQGQLVILGTTGSDNFPTSPQAADDTFGGGAAINYPSNGTNFTAGTDIAVVVLSADGTSLIGGTYLGGTSNDGLNMDADLLFNYGDQFRGEVIVDSLDNVYIGSSTVSDDFPASPGSVSGNLGGAQDGCLAKFNSNLSTLEWATYLGGSDADAAFSIKLNSTLEIYVTGGTQSNDFQANPGSLNPSFLGGAADGYVARISNDGSSIINASFIGTADFDQSYFADIDNDDDVYLYGQALGSYPVGGTVYSDPGSKQFIQKLTPDLSTSLYSSVFGSGGPDINISPTALSIDVCERVYISGWGGSTNSAAGGTTDGMQTSADAFQTNTDGSDFYFAVFEADMDELLYGTYFGGANSAEHVDGGTSRFDRNGVIYQAVCAACGAGNDFPVTPGAWSEIDGTNTLCNLGVIKLDLEIPQLDVTITSTGNLTGCAPHTVQFNSDTFNVLTLEWDFGDGNTSTDLNPQHIFEAPGQYTVVLTGENPNLCGSEVFIDTAIVIVNVTEAAIPADAGADQESCAGEAVSIGVPPTAGITYSWSPPGLVADPAASQTTATVVPPQELVLTITDSEGCQDTDTMTVSLFSIGVDGDTLVCAGDDAQLNAQGGTDWTWSPPGLLDDPTSQNPVANPLTATTFTVIVESVGGCQAVGQITVNVNPLPTANAGQDQTICAGDTAQLSAQGGNVFSWNPGGSLNDPSSASPFAFPNSTTTYEVEVTDQNGCKDIDSVTVDVNPPPPVVAWPDTLICKGDTAQLSVTGALTYTWSPLGGLIDPNDQPLASPTFSTTYYVEGEDDNGCKALDSVFVEVFRITAGPDTSLCEGDSVQAFVTGGSTFSWTPAIAVSDPSVSNPYLYTSESTQFNVSVISDEGCEDDAVVSVALLDPPNADFSASVQPSCEGIEIDLTNNSAGADQYFWDLGDGTTDSSLNVIHEYVAGNGPVISLYAYNNGGLCVDTFVLDLSDQLLGFDTLEVELGNVITPNYDGFNDCFQPYFDGAYSDCYELEVYNRWGVLLFRSAAGIRHCWDGRTKAGNPVETGTYYFIVKINDYDEAGYVTVLD